ncbi:IS630 family transposase [Orientia tsutsugamushi]|uniref:hypothetical protein n=1 Tax=Orientia tsutsugamushi TaxID=784 RepID=UPI0005F9607D|nr:hypothetical protein [Orientia tsutsugamushi]KJV75479.1 putative transposase [Orientia tsutsugamushi str. TA763]SPP23618.1 IS630 family transposase [Orientia tsutsugamushi]
MVIKKLCYSYKKSFYHSKNTMLRNEFIEIIKTIPKDKIVFIDEFGIEDNAYLNCGSSSIGRMCAMAKKAY